MGKQIADLTVTYLPFTFLEEQDLKQLVLYFHNIRLLQVLPDFDPGLPHILRASSLVQSFCPISTSLLETVKRAHQAYHQLGSVHQDGGWFNYFDPTLSKRISRTPGRVWLLT
jgi:hypothetical protein